MFEDNQCDSWKQILCCDAEPDSRQKLTEKLISFGCSVLATGNPQIASGLIQEQNIAALVVSMDKMKLSMVSIIVDARRSRPHLPIIIILTEVGHDTIPVGLADLVLVSPSDRKIKQAVVSFVKMDKEQMVAC